MNNNNLQDSGVKLLCTGLESLKCKLETLLLCKCDLTEESCSALASVLSSDSSILKDLDLSNNNLQNSGVKLLSDGLKNNCKLEKLRVSNCSITEEGYKALASALRSNPSHLIELDLRENDPGQSGVKELDDLLQDQNCKLKTLRFLSHDADKACEYVRGIVGKNPLLLRELNLSERELEDTRVNQIAALLQDKHCKLNTLMLNNNSITAEGCAALTSAFNSNPSNLIELDLSENKLGNSGIKKICSLLENTQCRIEKLNLSGCSITEEGYKGLTSSLKSNSHLTELDLTENDPGQSGVKELNELLRLESCKLKNIRFLKSVAAQEACDYLTKVLGKSPLILTELDLSEDKLGDLDWEKLSALLTDSHCKVEKIKLNNCEQTEKSCSVLATVLSSKTILKELNLNNSRLLNSGVKEICEGLKKSTLKILKLSDCSITEEGYKALASALRSNPSHLIELDLRGNDPGQSGVKELCDVQPNWLNRLKTLRLVFTFLGPAADEACQYVKGIVRENPLLLRELNLSERELGETRVNQIAALLQDKHCKLNTLSLSDCSITEEGYKALASALRSNPSHLIELDLRGNDPGQSGVKELDDLLQDQKYQLKTLRFLIPAAEEAFHYVRRIVGKNLLLLRELNLSERDLKDTGVNQIVALLKDKHCKLNTLMLNYNSITAEGCAALTSAFNSNPSNLIELDLSENKLGNSGIKKICVLLENTQCRLKKLKLSDCSITEEGYKALASALRSNPSHLIELDLTGNDPGQSGVKELSDLLQDHSCSLKTLRFLGPAADKACEYVSGIVGKNPLLQRELNLSERELGDTGVYQIAALLQDKHCKLNTLILSDCSITEEGYKALASALRSNPSHLIELDLRGNDPGQSGVKELDDLLKNERCTLKTIRFLKRAAAQEACECLTKVLGKSPLLLTELDLSEDKLKDLNGEKLSALLMDSHSKVDKIKLNNCELTEKSCSVLATVLSSKTILKELNLNNSRLLNSGVKEICEGLKKPVCELKILKLSKCDLTEESCSALASVLSSDSNLKDLDLSNNNLQDSGVKLLSDGLKENCNLERLRLSDCSITEGGYKALASALRSNPSHLIELDLTGNDPGQSGVKELDDLLQDPSCSLKTLRFLSHDADKACQYVRGIVGKNPLVQRELNLSGRELRDTRVNQIAALLKDKHCKLNTLMLNNNSITAEGCAALTSAFNSNPSNLIELDLSENKLGKSGVEKICPLLENPKCILEKIKLSGCSITEEGYKALASALRSNPSHLIELDLRGNDPGQSGVKELSDLLQDQKCSLKTLRLRGCDMTDEGCSAVTSALNSNPSHLRELDLSENKLGDSGVRNLSDLLKNPQCKLENLHLCGCSITETQCRLLTQAMCYSLSHLRKLDFSGNQIENKGLKILCDVLKNSQCKLEILSSVVDKSDLSSVVDKSDLSSVVDKSDLSSEVDKSDLSSVVDKSDLSSEVDKSDLSSVVDKSDLSSVVDKSDLSSVVDKSDLSSVVDKSDLSSVVDKSDLSSVVDKSDLSSVVDKSDLRSVVDKSDLSSVVDKSDLRSVVDKPDLSSEVDKSDLSSVVDKSDLSSVVDKSDLSSVVDKSDLRSVVDKPDLSSVVDKHEYGSSV
ncbi:unnamed protein product [Leuciscus chuanchicus]